MKRPERKRTISSRKDQYMTALLLVAMGALIFRIPLGIMIGDKGITCYASAYEIYLVVAGTASYGLSEAVAALVKFRVKREQYKNARKVLNGALLFGGALGLIFSAFFCISGQFAAEKILHVPLAGLAVSMMAPSMFFIILTGVFKGYFQGSGSRMPALHSNILHLIIMLAGGLSGAAFVHGYGLKVSALLQNDDYAGAYGAMGASIGLLAASILCFLHMLVLYFIYKSSLKKQTGREVPKNQEFGFHIIHMLVGTGVMYSLVWLCFQGLPLIDQYLFFLLGDRSGENIAAWGVYYGKCLVFSGVISGIIIIFCRGAVRRTAGLIERDEQRMAREKLGILIHQCAVISLPAAVLLAVFSGNLLEILSADTGRQIVGWMQLASILIVFCVYTAVFVEILVRSRRIKYVVLIGAGALLLHVGFLSLMLKITKLGITAVLIAVIAFYVLAAGAGFWLISRFIQYKQEWIKSFAITIIDSAISGVIAMLLNKVFSPLLGVAVSMIICLLTAIIVYLVLLVVTRAFDEGELEEMTGGGILIMLMGMLRFR